MPNEATAKVNGIVSSRRGQILGYDARAGWPGWDQISAHMPQAELRDLITELRSVSQGVGAYNWRFDHLQELTGGHRYAGPCARTAEFPAPRHHGP